MGVIDTNDENMVTKHYLSFLLTVDEERMITIFASFTL